MLSLKLPKEDKEALIDRLQQYLANELNVEAGRLAAELLLDHMMKQIAPYAYNRGVADSRAMLAERLSSLEDEMYALEQPIRPDRSR